jgi:hypothetical protein
MTRDARKASVFRLPRSPGYRPFPQPSGPLRTLLCKPSSSTVKLVRLFTLPEVSKRLNRNPVLVRRWLREGRLKGEKYGRDWLVSDAELRRFQTRQPERRERRA